MFGDDDGVEPQLMAGDYNYTEDKNNGDDINDGHADDNEGTEDKNNGYDINDGHADDNEGTDVLCALCDDGGKLLSCIGQCKRSFHPRKEDGRESKCKTLGYTSKKLKRIGAYVCNNCKYKKHQCFKCAELEPSDDPNAKVFKCKDSSCGHFYHPKCVAKLLVPDDSDGAGNCELEKRIMAGMAFTCPVHWCFECRRMENKTRRAMQFAACRRCPKSYHRKCLPRGISFDTKDKQVKQCAWELSKIIMIYCLDHEICKATGNAKRDHIKFPIIPKISKVSNLCKKKVDMIGKRKRSISQCSKKFIKVSKRLSSENNEHTKRAAADTSSEHMVLKTENPAMSLKKDLQLEASVVGAADVSVLEASRGQGKQFESFSSFVRGTRMPSDAVDGKSGKRGTSKPKKETSSRKLCSFAKKCIVPSEGIFDCSVQQDILLNKPSLDKDAVLENEIYKILEDKDGNKKKESSEHYSEKEGANKKVTSRETEQNDVSEKIFMDKHPEGNWSKFKSREERIIVLEEKADGCNLVSGDGENQLYRMPNGQDSKSERKIARNDSSTSIPGNAGVTPDHVDVAPEKQLIVGHVHRTTDKIDSQPVYGCKTRQGTGSSTSELQWQVTFSSNDTYDSKRWGSMWSASQPAGFGAGQWHGQRDGGGADHGDTSHQHPSELKEAQLYGPEKSNRKSGDSSLCCDGENRVAETSDGKTRQGTGSSSREQLQWQVKFSSNDTYYDSSKRWGNMGSAFSSNDGNDSNRWGNMRSAPPPAGFSAGQWHGHFSLNTMQISCFRTHRCRVVMRIEVI